MPKVRFSMRWWLALAFALIAAVTAVAVAQVFSQRTEDALRDRAEDLAIGSSVAAADALQRAVRRGDLERTLGVVSERRRLSLFVFSGNGALLSPARSRRVDLADVPDYERAVAAALDGRRFIRTHDDGALTVIGLRMSAPSRDRVGGPSLALEPVPEPGAPAVVLAYASRPELVAEAGILRDKIVEAALIAIAIGAVVGLLVALVITSRLRRIAAAAAAIEAGQFERPLDTHFPDELGALGRTIDGMRVRLRDSFARVESERDRLERLLGRLQEGVVTVDAGLEVEFANGSALELLDVASLAEGEPLPDPWPDVSLRRLAAGLFHPGAPVAQARVAPDEERTLMVLGLPARSPGDAAVLVVTDVSERERRERAEREFVTNAAHELRTPLTAITSAVEVLQGGAKDVPEERDRFLAHIQRESERLGRLTRALLVLARAQNRSEPPAAAPVTLRPLLADVAAGLRPATGVEVVVECPAGLQAIADRDLVEQAIANVAANAARHTSQGRIELRARRLSLDAVAIEVIDTGPGIPAVERERVFDRFYRGGDRRADGFGLGLAIVRQAARALGGRVELESSPGRGTTVRLVLPAAEAAAA